MREAVASWTEQLGAAGLLARYGGEEFAVLLPGLTAVGGAGPYRGPARCHPTRTDLLGRSEHLGHPHRTSPGGRVRRPGALRGQEDRPRPRSQPRRHGLRHDPAAGAADVPHRAAADRRHRDGQDRRARGAHPLRRNGQRPSGSLPPGTHRRVRRPPRGRDDHRRPRRSRSTRGSGPLRQRLRARPHLQPVLGADAGTPRHRCGGAHRGPGAHGRRHSRGRRGAAALAGCIRRSGRPRRRRWRVLPDGRTAPRRRQGRPFAGPRLRQPGRPERRTASVGDLCAGTRRRGVRRGRGGRRRPRSPRRARREPRPRIPARPARPTLAGREISDRTEHPSVNSGEEPVSTT